MKTKSLKELLPVEIKPTHENLDALFLNHSVITLRMLNDSLLSIDIDMDSNIDYDNNHISFLEKTMNPNWNVKDRSNDWLYIYHNINFNSIQSIFGLLP